VNIRYQPKFSDTVKQQRDKKNEGTFESWQNHY